MDGEIEISLFKDIEDKFTNHLNLSKNIRIVFSGKFGSGKTTFLRHYFGKNNSYCAFHLFPVNYSIGSNQDIIEYLKYDIIIEILKKRIAVEETDLRFIDVLPMYVKKFSLDSLLSVALMVSNLGKDNSENLKAFKLLEETYKKIKPKIDNYLKDIQNKVEADQLLNYLSKIENKEGSIYQLDVVTTLIEKVLSRHKTNNKILNTLIIDDLDRIDPEHIFRILNVLSAHLDNTSFHYPNKFGFDQIILVCDISNIRNIFKARYGIKSDFNGYVEKFFSHNVFDFDIKTTIEKSWDVFLNQANFIHQDETAKYYHNRAIQSSRFLADMVTLFVLEGIITINHFSKIREIKMELYESYVWIKKNLPISIENFPIIYQLKVLRRLFGNFDSFAEGIGHLTSYIGSSIHFNPYAYEIIVIFSLERESFKDEIVYDLNVSDKKFYGVFRNEKLVFLSKEPFADPKSLKDAAPHYEFSFEEFKELLEMLVYSLRNFL